MFMSLAGAAASTSGSLFPGLALLPGAAKPSGACQQALLNASNAHNLTFLVQVCYLFLVFSAMHRHLMAGQCCGYWGHMRSKKPLSQRVQCLVCAQ